MYFEVFLVQIRQKIQKIYFEVRLQGKKTSKNTFQNLKLGAKTEIQRGKNHGGGKRKFLINPI
jgi:hypothetical protein